MLVTSTNWVSFVTFAQISLSILQNFLPTVLPMVTFRWYSTPVRQSSSVDDVSTEVRVSSFFPHTQHRAKRWRFWHLRQVSQHNLRSKLEKFFFCTHSSQMIPMKSENSSPHTEKTRENNHTHFSWPRRNERCTADVIHFPKSQTSQLSGATQRALLSYA